MPLVGVSCVHVRTGGKRGKDYTYTIGRRNVCGRTLQYNNNILYAAVYRFGSRRIRVMCFSTPDFFPSLYFCPDRRARLQYNIMFKLRYDYINT